MGGLMIRVNCTELLLIVSEKFFKNGKPVISTVALAAGDFKACGQSWECLCCKVDKLLTFWQRM